MTRTADSLKADGWRPFELSGFSRHLSPFWYRVTEGRLAAGFFVEPRHCNEHLGTVHGGALMTFADTVGGMQTSLALGHQRCATLQLQTQFTAVARVGEFVQCEPEIVRQTRDILFLRGVLRTDARPVLSFDGLWKVLAERTPEAQAEPM